MSSPRAATSVATRTAFASEVKRSCRAGKTRTHARTQGWGGRTGKGGFVAVVGGGVERGGGSGLKLMHRGDRLVPLKNECAYATKELYLFYEENMRRFTC